MVLTDALAGVEVLERARGDADPDLVRAQYDSRRIARGDVFVAMRGGTTDGNRFIDSALERGASAVVTDSREVWANAMKVPCVLVANGRRALATMAANLLGHPERKLNVTAVTGTNGKTTTAFLLEQMLRATGRKCVLIGTIETHVGDEVRPSAHTTPEASDLLQLFADGVAAGCTEVVMEMSSHALAQERVWGVPVDVAVFTNLTQDHLDFHGSMGAYASAKLRLFEGVGVPPPRISIINADDPMAKTFRSTAEKGGMVWTYGQDLLRSRPDFLASGVQLTGEGSKFELETSWGSVGVTSSFVGRVNTYNLLAACGAALARHLSLAEISSSIPKLVAVPGRFETVRNELGFFVVVDYAHTDDALRNLVGLAREMVGTSRVITMFGCGGDRDRTKRAKMGRAAGEGSDLVVVTSDNPRSEEPLAIIDEVLVGVRATGCKYIVEPDRATAIALAIGRAKLGDIVLLAGKGHEKAQIVQGVELPFDDVAFAKEVLLERAASIVDGAGKVDSDHKH